MTGALLPPSSARDAKRLEQRVTELERRLGNDPYARRKPRPKLTRAVGAHVQTPGFDIICSDGNFALAINMVVEHDSGDGVAATDRLNVPTGYAGIWDVELHANAAGSLADWPAGWKWNAYLYHKASTGATLDSYPMGPASYNMTQQMGTHIEASSGDYFSVLFEWASPTFAAGGRAFQVSCLSAYFMGTA